MPPICFSSLACLFSVVLSRPYGCRCFPPGGLFIPSTSSCLLLPPTTHAHETPLLFSSAAGIALLLNSVGGEWLQGTLALNFVASGHCDHLQEFEDDVDPEKGNYGMPKVRERANTLCAECCRRLFGSLPEDDAW